MTITITQIARNNKVSKAGKPYVSLGIKCNEYGDRFINGFGGKENDSWKVGDTVEVDIETKGEYLNFSMPKATHQVGGTSGDINRVEAKVDALRAELATLGGTMTSIKGVLGEILQKVAPATDNPYDI